MKKLALISCLLGFTFLIVGGMLASPSIQRSLELIIPSKGRILYPDESQYPEEAQSTQLHQIGYLTILGSIGFFSVAFLYSRKSKG